MKVKVSKIDRDNFLLTNFGREVHSFPDFSIARVNAHTRMRVGEGQKFPKLIVEISYLVTLDEKCTHSPETRYLRQREKLIINKKVEFRPREHVVLAGEDLACLRGLLIVQSITATYIPVSPTTPFYPNVQNL